MGCGEGKTWGPDLRRGLSDLTVSKGGSVSAGIPHLPAVRTWTDRTHQLCMPGHCHPERAVCIRGYVVITHVTGLTL